MPLLTPGNFEPAGEVISRDEARWLFLEAVRRKVPDVLLDLAAEPLSTLCAPIACLDVRSNDSWPFGRRPLLVATRPPSQRTRRRLQHGRRIDGAGVVYRARLRLLVAQDQVMSDHMDTHQRALDAWATKWKLDCYWARQCAIDTLDHWRQLRLWDATAALDA